MNTISYSKGRYSQLKLDDASRIFVNTRPRKIRFWRMFLGAIPTKLVWEFEFPFLIRPRTAPTEHSTKILDLSLESIKDCTNLNEVTKRLNQTTKVILQDFIEKELKKIAADALAKTIDPRKRETLQNIVTPIQDREIISAFGGVLEELPADPLFPVSKLPFPRERIEKAINNTLETVEDENVREALKSYLVFLETFVPDKEIPSVSFKGNEVLWADAIVKWDKQRKKTQ